MSYITNDDRKNIQEAMNLIGDDEVIFMAFLETYAKEHNVSKINFKTKGSSCKIEMTSKEATKNL